MVCKYFIAMMVMLRLSDLGKAYIEVVHVFFSPKPHPWCEGERVALSSQRL